MNEVKGLDSSFAGPAALEVLLEQILEQGGVYNDVRVLGENPQAIRTALNVIRDSGDGILYGIKEGITIPAISESLNKKFFSEMLEEKSWFSKLQEDSPGLTCDKDFTDRFYGLVVKSHESYSLHSAKLVSECTEVAILSKLDQRAEVTLDAVSRAIMFHGQSGKYLSTKNKNIFFVKDVSKELCAVLVQWAEDHWHLDVLPDTFIYSGGTQIVSRYCYKEP